MMKGDFFYEENSTHLDGSLYLETQISGMNVRLNERHIPVLEQNGQPQIYAPVGSFNIDGFIVWNRIPSELSLPKSIGIIQASINTTSIDIQLDDKGQAAAGKRYRHTHHASDFNCESFVE